MAFPGSAIISDLPGPAGNKPAGSALPGALNRSVGGFDMRSQAGKFLPRALQA